MAGEIDNAWLYAEALLGVKKAAVFLESHELLSTSCSSNYIQLQSLACGVDLTNRDLRM